MDVGYWLVHITLLVASISSHYVPETYEVVPFPLLGFLEPGNPLWTILVYLMLWGLLIFIHWKAGIRVPPFSETYYFPKNGSAFTIIEEYYMAFCKAIENCRTAKTFDSPVWQDAYTRLACLRDKYHKENNNLTPSEREALSNVFDNDECAKGTTNTTGHSQSINHMEQLGTIKKRIGAAIRRAKL